MDIRKILEDNGISKVHIAKSIGMNEGTFKNKLRDGHSAHFTEDEIKMIKTVLGDIAARINEVIDGIE